MFTVVNKLPLTGTGALMTVILVVSVIVIAASTLPLTGTGALLRLTSSTSLTILQQREIVSVAEVVLCVCLYGYESGCACEFTSETNADESGFVVIA
jgi:hypothetical protein